MSDPRPPFPDPLPAPLARVATPDLNAERLAALKRLLPDLFTAEGRLNPDELRRLADAQGTADAERYEFKWYGKQRSKRHAFTPSLAALAYDAKRSCRPEKAGGNAIIEGENLEVLKLLLPAYRGRVKCILIDPPYNTGKDFVYRDNYARDRKEYWEETGVTEQGVKVDTNTDTSGRYHSDWLSMMHSRLLLARQFLTEDGVIFVHIDDNEVCNLRRALDEVFGEDCFVSQVIWQRSKKGDAKLIARTHEYIVCYVKNSNHALAHGPWRRKKPGADGVLAHYQTLREKYGAQAHDAIQTQIREWFADLPKDDPRKAHAHYRWSDDRGLYFADNFAGPDDGRDSRPRYDILHPRTGKPCKKPSTGWRWDEAKTQAALAEVPPRIHFGPDETTIPCRKSYLHEIDSEAFASVFYRDGRAATLEVESLVGPGVFEFPKDKDVLAELIALTTGPDDIVLDFFAGSGSTGHAVWTQNQKDGGRRQFLLVQIPEFTEPNTAARRAGFTRVSDVTICRLTKAAARMSESPRAANADRAELPGVAEEFVGGVAAAAPFDAGFRVYRLRPSYFPRCEWAPDPAKTEAENLAALDATLKAKEASLTMQFDADLLLEEVLLKQGFGFARTLVRLESEFPKNTVYEVRDGERAALVCLDAQLAPETIDALQRRKPEQRFVCLELALDTTRKWTLTQHLGDYLSAL